jgi:hypothetical protein
MKPADGIARESGARAQLRRRVELGRLRRALGELETRRRSRSGDASARGAFLPTGFAELDDALGGGWHVGALNEVLVAGPGSGALEAFLPALARAHEVRARGDAARPRLLAWIHPTERPYPPALAQAGFDLARWLLVRPRDARDQAWALDLALRSGACDAVVATVGGAHGPAFGDLALRRLQLAAEATGTLALFVRPLRCAAAPSPAAVRLRATARGAPPESRATRRRLEIEVLRCRGQVTPSLPLVLEWSRDPLDEPAPAALRARTAAARLPAGQTDDDRRSRGVARPVRDVARRALGA